MLLPVTGHQVTSRIPDTEQDVRDQPGEEAQEPDSTDGPPPTLRFQPEDATPPRRVGARRFTLAVFDGGSLEHTERDQVSACDGWPHNPGIRHADLRFKPT